MRSARGESHRLRLRGGLSRTAISKPLMKSEFRFVPRPTKSQSHFIKGGRSHVGTPSCKESRTAFGASRDDSGRNDTSPLSTPSRTAWATTARDSPPPDPPPQPADRRSRHRTRRSGADHAQRIAGALTDAPIPATLAPARRGPATCRSHPCPFTHDVLQTVVFTAASCVFSQHRERPPTPSARVVSRIVALMARLTGAWRPSAD